MKHSDWIGLQVKAASDIVLDNKNVIPANTILRVLAAKHCRLTVEEDCPYPMFKADNVSMGAVQILGRTK